MLWRPVHLFYFCFRSEFLPSGQFRYLLASYGSNEVLLLWLLIIAIIPNHSAGLVNSIHSLVSFIPISESISVEAPVASLCSALTS